MNPNTAGAAPYHGDRVDGVSPDSEQSASPTITNPAAEPPRQIPDLPPGVDPVQVLRRALLSWLAGEELLVDQLDVLARMLALLPADEVARAAEELRARQAETERREAEAERSARAVPSRMAAEAAAWQARLDAGARAEIDAVLEVLDPERLPRVTLPFVDGFVLVSADGEGLSWGRTAEAAVADHRDIVRSMTATAEDLASSFGIEENLRWLVDGLGIARVRMPPGLLDFLVRMTSVQLGPVERDSAEVPTETFYALVEGEELTIREFGRSADEARARHLAWWREVENETEEEALAKLEGTHVVRIELPPGLVHGPDGLDHLEPLQPKLRPFHEHLRAAMLDVVTAEDLVGALAEQGRPATLDQVRSWLDGTATPGPGHVLALAEILEVWDARPAWFRAARRGPVT